MLDDRKVPETHLGFPRSSRSLLVAALAIVVWGCAEVHQPGGETAKAAGGNAETASAQSDVAQTAGTPVAVAPAAVLQAAQTDRSADRGVSGVWQGISISDCVGEPADPGRCSAMQRITLTMFQQGATVTGFYKCAYGNQVCRHMDETGVIRNGTLKSTRLMMRIMHEDGSMCFFTGRPDGDRFEGGYECLQGGGIVEQGTFQTRRTY
jgi:hypothetical protein